MQALKLIFLFLITLFSNVACNNSGSASSNLNQSTINLKQKSTTLKISTSSNDNDLKNIPYSIPGGVVFLNKMPLPNNQLGTPIIPVTPTNSPAITSILAIESAAFVTTPASTYSVTNLFNAMPSQWNPLAVENTMSTISPIITDGTNLYVAIDVVGTGMITVMTKSMYGNDNWVLLVPDSPNTKSYIDHSCTAQATVSIVAYSGNIYVGSCYTVYEATRDRENPALTWEAIATIPLSLTDPVANPIDAMHLANIDGKTNIYIVDVNDAVRKYEQVSPNEDENWTTIGVLNDYVCGDPDTNGLDSNIFSDPADSSGFYICTLSGVTKVTTDGLDAYPSLPSIYRNNNGGDMSAVTEDGQVYYTNSKQILHFNQETSNWEELTNNVLNLEAANTTITSMTTHGSLLYVGTSAGNLWYSNPTAINSYWVNVTADNTVRHGVEITQLTDNNELGKMGLYALTNNNEILEMVNPTGTSYTGWNKLVDSDFLENENIGQIVAANNIVYFLTDKNHIYYSSVKNNFYPIQCNAPFNVDQITTFSWHDGSPYIFALAKDNNNPPYTTDQLYSNLGCNPDSSWVPRGPRYGMVSAICRNLDNIYIASNSGGPTLESWGLYGAPDDITYNSQSTVPWKFVEGSFESLPISGCWVAPKPEKIKTQRQVSQSPDGAIEFIVITKATFMRSIMSDDVMRVDITGFLPNVIRTEFYFNVPSNWTDGSWQYRLDSSNLEINEFQSDVSNYRIIARINLYNRSGEFIGSRLAYAPIVTGQPTVNWRWIDTGQVVNMDPGYCQLM